MNGLLVIAQLVVMAHAPDTGTTCAPMEISVAARSTGSTPPHIAFPTAPTLQLLKSTLTSRVERGGNGQESAITEAVYLVTSEVSGRVTIPPFVATVGSSKSIAQTSVVDVRASGTLPPTVLVRAWLDHAREAMSDTLIVGEQADYVVDVKLNEAARVRLRRNPTFFPPEMPGVLAYDLAAPTAIARGGHRCFETLSYRRALFPLFAGRAAIAPAALTYSLPLSTSFFSREENFELRTDSVRFVAVDVPAIGRPADFGGAVGDISVSSHVSASNARMGDPVIFTLRVEGAGNVKLWPRPAFALPWATVAQGDERVSVDTTQARVRGAKEFDWLVTPTKPGSQTIPLLSYPYFESNKSVYARAETSPITLDVVSAVLASVDSTPATRLAIRRVLRDEPSLPFHSQPWFWIVMAVAPLPAFTRRIRRRSSDRTDRRSSLRRLRDAADATDAASPREIRRLFLEAVGERVPASRASSRPHEFVVALRRAGVTEESAQRASAFLNVLDDAAFSPAGTANVATIAEARLIADLVDAQAVTVAKVARAMKAFVLIALLVAANAHALNDADRQTFAGGVQAYDRGSFGSASQAFGNVASHLPRAVDAWADLGVAQWARGDSAAAARAWQRALRIDPLDAEVRAHLETVHPAELRSPGYVAPVPPNYIFASVLLCWIVAWILLALPVARRPMNARAVAGGAITIAAVLTLGGLQVARHNGMRGIGVLRIAEVLLEDPTTSTAAASGSLGEVATLGERDGTWVHITLDATRSGWVPVSSVIALDAPATDN